MMMGNDGDHRIFNKRASNPGQGLKGSQIFKDSESSLINERNDKSDAVVDLPLVDPPSRLQKPRKKSWQMRNYAASQS